MQPMRRRVVHDGHPFTPIEHSENTHKHCLVSKWIREIHVQAIAVLQVYCSIPYTDQKPHQKWMRCMFGTSALQNQWWFCKRSCYNMETRTLYSTTSPAHVQSSASKSSLSTRCNRVSMVAAIRGSSTVSNNNIIKASAVSSRQGADKYHPRTPLEIFIEHTNSA